MLQFVKRMRLFKFEALTRFSSSLLSPNPLVIVVPSCSLLLLVGCLSKHAQDSDIEDLSAELICCDTPAPGCALGENRWSEALTDYEPITPIKGSGPGGFGRSFAWYTARLHNLIHPKFTEFLESLENLPTEHLLNDPTLRTVLELGVDGLSGCLTRIGVIESSGARDFDLGVLDSIAAAMPYPPAPVETWSKGGVVYVRWEFYRKPEFACSTYFSRPYKLAK
jgi:hypothetical protein